MYRPFEAFSPGGRFISVVGSGGKTTLLRRLAERLPGSVVLTTSTRIYPFPGIPLATEAAGLKSALSKSRVVCLGRALPGGKLADPSGSISFEALKAMADYVLVEADGSAGRPLKAHRPWEPVIPACSDLTVCVIGASGIGMPVSEACHCPELFASLAGMDPEQPASEEHIARVVNRERLADCCLVNQIDALPDIERARRLCALIRVDAFPCALAPRR